MSMSLSRKSALLLGSSVTLLTGCAVGPDYVQPTVPEPTAYKESGPWKKASPRDDISKGDWYKIFHDPKLNELEAEATTSSQTLRAAIARVSEERALARQTEAAFFPSIDFEGNGSRQRTSPNDGQLHAQAPSGEAKPYTFDSATVVPFDLSYELDIWGKIRRSFEAAGDTAQASLADYENILLGLKADVATNYFALRTADAEISVQLRTIQSYQQNLNLTNSRFQAGSARSSTSTRPRRRSPPPRRSSRRCARNAPSSSTPSPSCWAIRPRAFPSLTIRSTSGPRPFPPACRPTCSSADPMWPPPNAASPRRTRRLAWPSPRTFPW